MLRNCLSLRHSNVHIITCASQRGVETWEARSVSWTQSKGRLTHQDSHLLLAEEPAKDAGESESHPGARKSIWNRAKLHSWATAWWRLQKVWCGRPALFTKTTIFKGLWRSLGLGWLGLTMVVHSTAPHILPLNINLASEITHLQASGSEAPPPIFSSEFLPKFCKKIHFSVERKVRIFN